MKRRRFLALTGGGLLLVGTGGLLWRVGSAPEPATFGVHLGALARDMSGAAVIGRAWLNANEGSEPKRELIEELALDPNDEIEYDTFVERLAQRVERDFEAQAILEHDGWWLSETEARLAALHVALLGFEASEPAEPGFEQSREGRLVRVRDQNPGSAKRGEPLTHPTLPDNVLSFRTSRRPPNRLMLVVEGHQRPISAGAEGFSVTLNDAALAAIARAGDEVDLWLYDPVAQRRQMVGTLLLEEPAGNEDGFCKPTDWGARATRAGEAFNEQPDGSAAFWIQARCFPEQTVVVFDNVELPTTLQPDEGLITARLPDPTLYARPGEYRIELLDRDSGAAQLVGDFTVHE
jgi:hypothetical protein